MGLRRAAGPGRGRQLRAEAAAVSAGTAAGLRLRLLMLMAASGTSPEGNTEEPRSEGLNHHLMIQLKLGRSSRRRRRLRWCGDSFSKWSRQV
ncbi:uncharacterized protein [Patagioenas fasciata]|uniref:uncharacterized protein n=1 Tax=Patagioenas fasciata TaxID=372321 RepID=UPI003A999DB4